MSRKVHKVMVMNKILKKKIAYFKKILHAQKNKNPRKVKVLHHNPIIKSSYLKALFLAGSMLVIPQNFSQSFSKTIRNEKNMQPTTHLNKISLEKAKEDIFKKGRFFINPNTKKFFYLTHAQCQELGIGAPSDITSICKARENGIYDDSSLEEIQKAYTNSKGAFYGPFQYTDINLKNAVLWAICQEKDPELIAFAKKMMPTPIRDSSENLKKFRESYQKAQDKMANGVSSTRALNEIYSFLSPLRKELLREMGLNNLSNSALDQQFDKATSSTDFATVKKFFDFSCCEMYMGLSSSQDNRYQLSPVASATFLMAQIHGNSKSNFTKALSNDIHGLINEHGIVNGSKTGIARMNKALGNIEKTVEGQKVLDLKFYEGYLKLCRPNELANLDKECNRFAMNLVQKDRAEAYFGDFGFNFIKDQYLNVAQLSQQDSTRQALFMQNVNFKKTENSL